MKIYLLILSLFIAMNFSFAQVKKRDLRGEWTTNNDVRKLLKTDTIKFYQKIDRFYKGEKTCMLLQWTLNRTEFHVHETNICKEPPTSRSFIAKERLKLKKKDFGQILEYYRDKKLINKFRIVELRKGNDPILKLIKFDSLNEQKLYKYIDSLVFKVLNYNPNKPENNYGVKISDSNSNVKIKIRDGGIGNPEPLVIVNGRPLQKREPLKELLLVETYAIKYLTREQSASIYGSRAINGVVLLLTSEKRFKRIWEKYGR